MRFTKQLLITGVALAATGLLSCSIPKPECQVGQTTYLGGQSLNDYAAFAVRYIPKGNVSCATVMTGEVIGMQTYHPSKEEDGQQVRDFETTTVAIRTENAAQLFWMVEDYGEEGAAAQQKPNAEGTFESTVPDDQELCHVSGISESRVSFAGAVVAVGEAQGETVSCVDDAECADLLGDATKCTAVGEDSLCTIELPAREIAYRWSNVQVYVTAAAPGTQFTADVDIEVDGCSASYTAVGMWPAVDCTDYEGTGLPDHNFCNPEPDPDNGRVYGSGVNPDFGPTQCDASIGVLQEADLYSTYVTTYDPFYGPGYGLTVPRCTLATDAIPALEGFRLPENPGGE